MKYFGHLLLLILLLTSCATKESNSGKKKEIAIATQRLGEELYNSGNYTRALQNLLEAYETIPNDPYLNNSLGLVYMAKERYDLAQTHFLKATKLKPDYIHAKNNLGGAFLKQEKWDLAIQNFEVVSKSLVYGTPEIPLSNLGWAYFNKRDYEKATFYFNKSLSFQPNFLVSLHGVASTYLRTGYYYQAIDYLHQKIKRNPGAAILHADLAKSYELVKDYKQAIKSWEVVLNLVPETSSLSVEAQERLMRLKN